MKSSDFHYSYHINAERTALKRVYETAHKSKRKYYWCRAAEVLSDSTRNRAHIDARFALAELVSSVMNKYQRINRQVYFNIRRKHRLKIPESSLSR